MAIKQAEEDDYAVAEDVLMLLAATPFSTMTTPIELSLRLSKSPQQRSNGRARAPRSGPGEKSHQQRGFFQIGETRSLGRSEGPFGA